MKRQTSTPRRYPITRAAELTLTPLSEAQSRWLTPVLPKLLPLGLGECRVAGLAEGQKLVLVTPQELWRYAELVAGTFEPLLSARLEAKSAGRLKGAVLLFEEVADAELQGRCPCDPARGTRAPGPPCAGGDPCLS